MAWRTIPRNIPDIDTTKMDVSQMLNELQQRQANELEARRDELNTLRRETMEATKLRDASHGTIRWDDHARRAARANGESGAGRAAILNAPREAAVNWRPWLWLVPVLIFGLVVGANYPGMLESWGLGGPGARHAEDVERAARCKPSLGPTARRKCDDLPHRQARAPPGPWVADFSSDAVRVRAPDNSGVARSTG